MAMKHFYRDVPRLGNVAVSRHAQARMEADGISQEVFDKALFEPTRPDVPDVMDILGASAMACGSSLLRILRQIQEQSS